MRLLLYSHIDRKIGQWERWQLTTHKSSSLNKSVLSDCSHALSSKNWFIKNNGKIIQIIECFHLTKTFFHIVVWYAILQILYYCITFYNESLLWRILNAYFLSLHKYIIKIHTSLHGYFFNQNCFHLIFLTSSFPLTFLSYFSQITVKVLVKKKNVKGKKPLQNP